MSQTKAELIDGKGDVVFDTDTLAVDATNNRVGIGEAAPGTQVEVNGAEPYITIKNSTEEDTDGGRESRIIFEGEQSGGEISTLAQIEVSHDGAVDDEKGKIVISTNDGTDGTAPTARVTVDAAGNVGIGTTSVDKKLVIAGNNTAGGENNTLRFVDTDTSSVSEQITGKIEFYTSDTDGAEVKGYFAGITRNNGGDGCLIFGTGGSAAATEKLRLDDSGRLLVGTTSSSTQAKLIVEGQTSNAAAGPIIKLQRGEAPGNIAAGEGLGNIEFGANDGGVFAQISAQADGNAGGANGYPGRLIFYTESLGSDSTPVERMRIHASGLITTEGRAVNSTDVNFMMRNNAGGADLIFEASNATVPGISGPIRVSKNATSNRSINASGTVNQNGNDYAEYLYKEGDFDVAKGDIVGINANGKLTNVYAQAISYCVKSTDPGIVGGDTWFTEPRPLDVDGYEVDSSTTEYAEWMERLETARQAVDRIAFCGQVPVNVTTATPGQFIIPVETDDGGISGIAKNQADLTFEEYMLAVGKVIAIEDDGRARIIVKIS